MKIKQYISFLLVVLFCSYVHPAQNQPPLIFDAIDQFYMQNDQPFFNWDKTTPAELGAYTASGLALLAVAIYSAYQNYQENKKQSATNDPALEQDFDIITILSNYWKEIVVGYAGGISLGIAAKKFFWPFESRIVGIDQNGFILASGDIAGTYRFSYYDSYAQSNVDTRSSYDRYARELSALFNRRFVGETQGVPNNRLMFE